MSLSVSTKLLCSLNVTSRLSRITIIAFGTVVTKTARQSTILIGAYLTSVDQYAGRLGSVNFAMQSIRKGCHDIQPWLFDNNHLVLTNKFHAKHTIVPQAHGACRWHGFISILVIVRCCRSRALSFAHVPFWKSATLLRKVERRVHGHDSTKRSLDKETSNQ